MLTAFILSMLAAPIEYTGPMKVGCLLQGQRILLDVHVRYFKWDPDTEKGYLRNASGAETWFRADTCEVHMGER